ncbi:MAG: thiamine-phosphate kinase [Alphaproteobacteria bacterium]
MADGSQRGEFQLINELLVPLAAGQTGAAGLSNDAATLDVPEGRQLVLTKDMMVAGVHFLPDDPPDLIARKLLRVNLSDIAAMGAKPEAYMLGLALPVEINDRWLESFTGGLAQDQQTFGIGLLGGDTVSSPGPLTLSVTALGTVEQGRAISRCGAQPGDKLVVTGTIGDAALGLQVLRGGIEDPSGYLADRYRLPRPRLHIGQAAVGIVSAGLDISDGLVADVSHLCAVSGVGAVIHADQIPLSPQAEAALEADPTLLETILTGGDDYELVFAVPPSQSDRFIALQKSAHCSVIGEVVRTPGVTVVNHFGASVSLKSSGFRHR